MKKLEERKIELEKEFEKVVELRKELSLKLQQANQRLIQMQGAYAEVAALCKADLAEKGNGTEALKKPKEDLLHASA